MSKKIKKKMNRRFIKWTSWLVLIASIIVIVTSIFMVAMMIREINSSRSSHNDSHITLYTLNRGYYVGYDKDHNRSLLKQGQSKPVIKEVDYVVGKGDDSIWIVFKDDRRIIFNTAQGKAITPHSYKHAWLPSDGVLAVVDTNNLLHFLTPDGNEAMDKTFQYDSSYPTDYLFRNGYCQIPCSDTLTHIGIIDKQGNWAINPLYDSINYVHGYWALFSNGTMQVVDSTLQIVISSVEGCRLEMTNDSNLIIFQINRPALLYNKMGFLISSCVIDNISELVYYDDDYNSISTGLYKYSVYEDHWGLMDKNGKSLTDAIFESISVEGKNLFRADLQRTIDDNESYSILLNSKGQLIQ